MNAPNPGQRARYQVGSEPDTAPAGRGLLLGFTALWQDRPLRTITITVVVFAAGHLLGGGRAADRGVRGRAGPAIRPGRRPGRGHMIDDDLDERS